MQVIYKQWYFDRDLFIIEHQGKLIMVYRSSGHSGTGHKDKILPFMFINTRFSIRECLGYIYKEMLYDGKYINHHKNLGYYPGVEGFCEQLQEFLKDETTETPDLDFENPDIFEDYITATSCNLHLVTKTLKDQFFDYKSLT